MPHTNIYYLVSYTHSVIQFIPTPVFQRYSSHSFYVFVHYAHNSSNNFILVEVFDYELSAYSVFFVFCYFYIILYQIIFQIILFQFIHIFFNNRSIMIWSTFWLHIS